MSFFSRLALAFRIIFGGAVPPASPELPVSEPKPLLPPTISPPPAAPTLSPEVVHASSLAVLGMLQREGRFLDFLQEDVSAFSDADIGAAARVVHEGCRKVLKQYLPVIAVVPQSEGDSVEVPTGYDANRYRLTGNVTGAGPWKGTLKHHGWVATSVQLPPLPTAVDVKVLAPAEVELP